MRVTLQKMGRAWPLYALIVPGMIFLIIFSYIPMVGVVIAFQKFIPTKGFFGSEWIGFDHFRLLLQLDDTKNIVRNTVVIASMKIVTGILVPLVMSLLLNEVRIRLWKRSIQTIVFFPHFMSWVILGGILTDVLSTNGGAINQILGWFGIEPILFLGSPKWFVGVIVISDVWKEFGFSMIVYLAALTGINQSLYEAAMIDGANRWKQTWHITIPGIMPIVVLMCTLSLGNILNAGFDQIFNLYNALVLETGDIIDTYVYRLGLVQAQYSLATAVGLFKSVIGFVLIVISYWMANRFANYRIF